MPNLRHLPLPHLDPEEAEGRALYLALREEARAELRARGASRGAVVARTVTAVAALGIFLGAAVRDDGFVMQIVRQTSGVAA